MKKLAATSLILAILLGGCASMDDSFAGLPVTHPNPETEMTKSACCLKPATP